MAPKHRRSQGARPKSIKTKSDQTKTKSGQTNSMRPDEFEVVQPSEPVEPAVTTEALRAGGLTKTREGTREFVQLLVKANRIRDFMAFLGEEDRVRVEGDMALVYDAHRSGQMDIEEVKSKMVDLFENNGQLLERFAREKLQLEPAIVQQWEQTMLDARKEDGGMAASEVSEALKAPDLGRQEPQSKVTHYYLSIHDPDKAQEFTEQMDRGNVVQAMGNLGPEILITEEEHKERVAKQHKEQKSKFSKMLIKHVTNGKHHPSGLLRLLYDDASSKYPDGVFAQYQDVLKSVLGRGSYIELQCHLLEHHEDIAKMLMYRDVSIMHMDLDYLATNRLSEPSKFGRRQFECWDDMTNFLDNKLEKSRNQDPEAYKELLNKVDTAKKQIENLIGKCVFLQLDEPSNDPWAGFPLETFRKKCRMIPDWTGKGYGSCYAHVRIEYVYLGENGHVMAQCTPVKEINAMISGGDTVVTIAHGVKVDSPYEIPFNERPAFPGEEPCDNANIRRREDLFHTAFSKYMQRKPDSTFITHLADIFSKDSDHKKAVDAYRRPQHKHITDKATRKETPFLYVWGWQRECEVVRAACGEEAYVSLVPCDVTPEYKLPEFDVPLFTLVSETEVLDIINDQRHRVSEAACEELLSELASPSKSPKKSPAKSPNKSPPESPTEPVQPQSKKTIRCWKCNQECSDPTDLKQHMMECLHPWLPTIVEQFAGNKQTVDMIRPKDEQTGKLKKLEQVSKADRYELAIEQLAKQTGKMKKLWDLIKEAAPRQVPGPVKSGKTKKKKQHKPQHQSQQEQHNATKACSESSEGSEPNPLTPEEEFWAGAGLWSAIVSELDQVEKSIQQNVCKSLLAQWHIAQLQHKEQVAERAVREAIMREQWESHYRPVEPSCQYVCSITDEVMEQPVVCEDGFSYEKDAIEMWIQKCLKQNSTQNTTATTTFASPRTNKQIGTTMLPNHDLRSLIDDWRTADTQAMIEWFEKNQ